MRRWLGSSACRCVRSAIRIWSCPCGSYVRGSCLCLFQWLDKLASVQSRNLQFITRHNNHFSCLHCQTSYSIRLRRLHACITGYKRCVNSPSVALYLRICWMPQWSSNTTNTSFGFCSEGVWLLYCAVYHPLLRIDLSNFLLHAFCSCARVECFVLQRFDCFISYQCEFASKSPNYISILKNHLYLQSHRELIANHVPRIYCFKLFYNWFHNNISCMLMLSIA